MIGDTSGRLPCAKLMIEYGADINREDTYGDRALDMSIKRMNSSISIELINAGADINYMNKNNRTPVSELIGSIPNIDDGELRKRDSDIVSVFDCMILNNLNPNLANACTSQSYPLHEVAKKGLLRETQSLISIGADVNAKNLDGEPVIYTAGKTDYHSVVKELLSCGANIDTDCGYDRSVFESESIADSCRALFKEHKLSKGIYMDSLAATPTPRRRF